MKACLPLQDCIVQTKSLPAYGWKFLPPRLSPDNKAIDLRPDNSSTAAVLTRLKMHSVLYPRDPRPQEQEQVQVQHATQVQVQEQEIDNLISIKGRRIC
jgi:hypothetical protein